jgi:hypothetical protein
MQKCSTNEFDFGAVFDPRRKYRYLLWRQWDKELPKLCWVMLNPSTADEQHNDPTISRCVGFAKRWGFGSMKVVNAFAYRATDSNELKRVRDPIGRQADEYIQEALASADKVVVAWGNWGTLLDRHLALNEMLSSSDLDVSCFGITNLKQPKHPLYLRNDSDLVPYRTH